MTGRSVLFIDGRRQVWSVREKDVPVPYVREYFRHDLMSVGMLFVTYRNDSAFIQALTDELVDTLGFVSWALPYPTGVLDAGERAVADEQIVVGAALASVVTVSFDADQPTAPHGFDAVMFASQPVAVDLLADVLKDADNRSAFEAALGHPAGRHTMQAGSAGAAPGNDELAQRAALLLAQRSLVLLPRDLWRKQLRLAWLEHQVPTIEVVDAPGPVTPVRVVPPPLPGPMSVLPDPPDELSPQAQTLIEAAKNGIPFCEECARRAAELAGA